MGDAVTACRFCHAAPEHIGHLAACPVVRAWFAPFLALVGVPNPSVPKLLFAFPSSGHGGIRHLAIITWRRILQLFYSDAAIFSHTTPDQVTKVALARFAELALALSHRILILNRIITITADRTHVRQHLERQVQQGCHGWIRLLLYIVVDSREQHFGRPLRWRGGAD
jgi:hypothetical protein